MKKPRLWQCKLEGDTVSFLVTADSEEEAVVNFLWFCQRNWGRTYDAKDVAVSEVVLKGLGYVGVAVGELPL